MEAKSTSELDTITASSSISYKCNCTKFTYCRGSSIMGRSSRYSSQYRSRVLFLLVTLAVCAFTAKKQVVIAEKTKTNLSLKQTETLSSSNHVPLWKEIVERQLQEEEEPEITLTFIYTVALEFVEPNATPQDFTLTQRGEWFVEAFNFLVADAWRQVQLEQDEDTAADVLNRKQRRIQQQNERVERENRKLQWEWDFISLQEILRQTNPLPEDGEETPEGPRIVYPTILDQLEAIECDECWLARHLVVVRGLDSNSGLLRSLQARVQRNLEDGWFLFWLSGRALPFGVQAKLVPIPDLTITGLPTFAPTLPPNMITDDMDRDSNRTTEEPTMEPTTTFNETTLEPSTLAPTSTPKEPTKAPNSPPSAIESDNGLEVYIIVLIGLAGSIGAFLVYWCCLREPNGRPKEANTNNLGQANRPHSTTKRQTADSMEDDIEALVSEATSPASMISQSPGFKDMQNLLHDNDDTRADPLYSPINPSPYSNDVQRNLVTAFDEKRDNSKSLHAAVDATGTVRLIQMRPNGHGTVEDPTRPPRPPKRSISDDSNGVTTDISEQEDSRNPATPPRHQPLETTESEAPHDTATFQTPERGHSLASSAVQNYQTPERSQVETQNEEGDEKGVPTTNGIPITPTESTSNNETLKSPRGPNKPPFVKRPSALRVDASGAVTFIEIRPEEKSQDATIEIKESLSRESVKVKPLTSNDVHERRTPVSKSPQSSPPNGDSPSRKKKTNSVSPSPQNSSQNGTTPPRKQSSPDSQFYLDMVASEHDMETIPIQLDKDPTSMLSQHEEIHRIKSRPPQLSSMQTLSRESKESQDSQFYLDLISPLSRTASDDSSILGEGADIASESLMKHPSSTIPGLPASTNPEDAIRAAIVSRTDFSEGMVETGQIIEAKGVPGISIADSSDMEETYYGGVYYGDSDEDADQSTIFRRRTPRPPASTSKDEDSQYGGVYYGSDEEDSRHSGNSEYHEEQMSQDYLSGYPRRSSWTTLQTQSSHASLGDGDSFPDGASYHSNTPIVDEREWQRRLREDLLHPVHEESEIVINNSMTSGGDGP